MKQKLLPVALMICSYMTAYAETKPEIHSTESIEVPAEILLAPAEGYDDNDNIQIILSGLLPNACYRLDRHEIDQSIEGTIGIKQYAVKMTDGICAEGGAMPEHLQIAVPFTSEISLGSLPAGFYSFKYKQGQSSFGTRGITVSKALKTSIDDLSYAAVTKAIVNDVIQINDDLIVTLTGVLTSTCIELDPNIQTKRMDDVYVILPTIKVKKGKMCLQTLIPFSRTLNLGKPEKAGRYLVHVRSITGKSINNLVEVQG